MKSGTRLIVGYGATGASVARYFEREGLTFAVTDSRESPPGAKAMDRVPHVFGYFGNPLPNARVEEAVVSPGISQEDSFLRALRSNNVPLVSDIELFARALERLRGTGPLVPQIVAITGTNGKSTVTRLVEAMARAGGRATAAGANLGTPALDLLAPGVELYVLELSSFQLALTHSLAPRVATVLNVSADHLDRHGSLEAYAAAKARIYERARTGVFNREDAVVNAMPAVGVERITFGLDAPPGPADYGIREGALYRGGHHLLDSAEVPLAGRHNLANVLAAWALAAAAGIDDADIACAVREFHPLPHRLTLVAEYAGVRYYDDSKATNVNAASASLEGLASPLVVIAGGQGKGQDFSAFADLLVARARAVVLIGADAPQIERALAGRLLVRRATDMNAAVVEANLVAQPGDAVVLAPACASLDMFSDYAARGDAFTKAVEALDEQ